jgi:uncharacterized membrane protein YgdD (TMEM256/DUF423 family)
MKSVQFLRIAAISGAIAVGLGALGAHALKPLIEPFRLAYFEKAVQYQFIHTLALLAVVAMIWRFGETARLIWAGWAFILGIICFSGSLYLLAMVQIMPVPTQILGPITPIGGLCYITGWILVLLTSFTSKAH